MKINNDALTWLKISTKARQHEEHIQREFSRLAEDIQTRINKAVNEYASFTRFQRIWNSIRYSDLGRLFCWFFSNNSFTTEPDWWALGYMSESVQLAEVKNWFTGKERPHECIVGSAMFDTILIYAGRLRALTDNENYRRAKMLLKYCKGMETLTVPLSFVEWLDK